MERGEANAEKGIQD